MSIDEKYDLIERLKSNEIEIALKTIKNNNISKIIYGYFKEYAIYVPINKNRIIINNVFEITFNYEKIYSHVPDCGVNFIINVYKNGLFFDKLEHLFIFNIINNVIIDEIIIINMIKYICNKINKDLIF